MKSYFTLFVFLSLILTIVKSDLNPVTFFVSNFGSDTVYCGSSSVSTCLTIGGAVNSYASQYQYTRYIEPPLVVQLASQYQYNGGLNPPVSLNRLNITINGAPDGTSSIFNSQGIYPLFNLTTIGYTTVIAFNNINYGQPGLSYCYSYSSSAGASLFSFTPDQYGAADGISISLNNFSISCNSQYLNLILINGTNIYSTEGPSEDYNTYNNYQEKLINTLSINIDGLTIYQTNTFTVPMINVTSLPVSITMKNSNLTGIVNIGDSLIKLGRGKLKVEESIFNVTLNNYGNYIFDVQSVETEFKNNSIFFNGGNSGCFLNCNGCFFNGNQLEITSNLMPGAESQYSILNFENSVATIMNSVINAPQQIIISAQSSLLSLRTNQFFTTYSDAIKIDGVSLFLFYNTFYRSTTYSYISSYVPVISCSTSSLSNVNGDDNSVSFYTSECSKYEYNQKLKWAFLFIAVGIVGCIVVMILLKASVAIIRRCGGGEESVSYSYNRINR